MAQEEAAQDQPMQHFVELGSTGLKRWSGYVDEEFHQDLRGTKAVRVYREMLDNHPIIGAIFLLVDLFVRQTPKRVEASGSSPQHALAKMICETSLDDMDGGIEAALSEALAMGPYGWAILEKVYKIRRGESDLPELQSKFSDGYIGVRKLATRAQESHLDWDFAANGVLRGWRQMPAPDYRTRYLPRSKFLHFRIRAPKDNPEGRSLCRPIYVPYFFQKNIQVIEGISLERDGSGLPVMEVPSEVITNPRMSQVFEQYKNMVRKLKVDEYGGVVIPAEDQPDGKKSGYRLRLLSASGRNINAADPIARRYRSEIAIGLFGEFVVLGTEKVGSFSMHSDKTEMFSLGVGSVLDAAQAPFNDDLFPELCVLNGLPASVAPKYTHGDVKTPSLQELGQFVAALTGGGAITVDDGLERYLREAGGLPAPEARPTAVQAPAAAPVAAPIEGVA